MNKVVYCNIVTVVCFNANADGRCQHTLHGPGECPNRSLTKAETTLVKYKEKDTAVKELQYV